MTWRLSEVSTAPSLSQALHMLNGPTIHQKIAQGGLIKQFFEAGKSPAEVIDAFYLRALSREPTNEEREQLLATLPPEGEQSEQVLQDIFWAVLNSREFLFNH